MNLLYWNPGGLSSRCEELLFFNLYKNIQLVKRDAFMLHGWTQMVVAHLINLCGLVVEAW